MFNATDVITILGKRGSGKSTLGRKIQAAFPRKLIIDRLHEYNIQDGRVIVGNFNDFGVSIKDSANKNAFELVFQFDIESGSHEEIFNEVLRVAYYRGSLCVVVEEVHHFASTHYLPQWFRECLLTGRHRQLSLICTSQRPAELHKTLLSQSSQIFAGCLYEKNDVEYLKSFMGDDAYRLKDIKPYHFLHFKPGSQSEIIYNG